MSNNTPGEFDVMLGNQDEPFVPNGREFVLAGPAGTTEKPANLHVILNTLQEGGIDPIIRRNMAAHAEMAYFLSKDPSQKATISQALLNTAEELDQCAMENRTPEIQSLHSRVLNAIGYLDDDHVAHYLLSGLWVTSTRLAAKKSIINFGPRALNELTNWYLRFGNNIARNDDSFFTPTVADAVDDIYFRMGEFSVPHLFRMMELNHEIDDWRFERRTQVLNILRREKIETRSEEYYVRGHYKFDVRAEDKIDGHIGRSESIYIDLSYENLNNVFDQLVASQGEDYSVAFTNTAILLLSERRFTPALPYLIDRMEQSYMQYGDISEVLFRAIGNYRDIEALPLLQRIIDDQINIINSLSNPASTPFYILRKAVEAIAGIAYPGSLPILEKVLKFENNDHITGYKEAAFQALARIKGNEAFQLLEQQTHNCELCESELVDALYYTSPDSSFESIKQVLEYMEEKESRLIHEPLRKIIKYKDRRFIPLLRKYSELQCVHFLPSWIQHECKKAIQEFDSLTEA